MAVLLNDADVNLETEVGRESGEEVTTFEVGVVMVHPCLFDSQTAQRRSETTGNYRTGQRSWQCPRTREGSEFR